LPCGVRAAAAGVRAVRFDQVERAQDGCIVAKPVAEDVEDREAVAGFRFFSSTLNLTFGEWR
jgi:hypothetical protein